MTVTIEPTIAPQPNGRFVPVQEVSRLASTLSGTLPSFTPSSTLFTQYGVVARFRSKVIGGVPRDPDIIQNWLRKNTGIDNTEELRRLTIETLRDRYGVEVPEAATEEQMREAVEAATAEYAGERHVNGFKRLPSGELFIEGRQVKAMMKEVTNILYAGERWGQTRKGPKSFLAERVFVRELAIPLGVYEPTGIERIIGHITDKNGPRSMLTDYEFVEVPTVAWTMSSLNDELGMEEWTELLTLAMENGLGSVRSQGYGTFDVVSFGVIHQGRTKELKRSIPRSAEAE